jgi:beta-lactamase regulating signal transducer with metallopeptidase domain
MTWFLTTSTALMTLALLVPARAGVWQRRVLELALLLILLLPGFREIVLLTASVVAEPDWVRPIQVPEMKLSDWLLGLWGLGMLLGCSMSLRQLYQVRSLLRESRALDETECRLINDVLHLHDHCLKKQFRVSMTLESPVVLPTVPGCVLLPMNWFAWSPSLQRGALRHEWHHVMHQDALLGCIMRVFCVVFWFHPLAWLLCRAWVAACEHEADRAAISGADPVRYADDLLALAKRQFTEGRGLPLLLPAFSRSSLSRRIELLFNTRDQSNASRIIALLCILLMGLCAISCAWIGGRKTTGDTLVNEIQMRLAAEAFPAD